MNTAPTYKEFRTLALSRGWTPKDLAPFVQADNPLKTAEHLLVHFAGTRWDDEPLPYPKLCELYRGSDATAPAAPAPRGHVELAEALVSGRKDRPWLKPDQYTVTHRFTDPYLYVTLDADAPREGIKTLAHLAGALSLETDEYGPRRVRFPYEAVYAAAQPYPGKELGQRCVCTQRKAASWMRPVSQWCAVPVDEDGPGSLRREQW
jgi:hypothetical protein